MFLASKIDLDNSYQIVNNNKVVIAFNVLYYAYNILASYAVLKLIGISEDKIARYISSITYNEKLNSTLRN